MKKWLVFFFLSVSSISAMAVSMPNPASVYCLDHGGQLKMINESAGVTGICVFPDKSYCEQWSYTRGVCKPSQFYLPEKKEGTKYCLKQLPNKNLVIYLCKEK